MRERTLPCLGRDGFHRMAYVQWGDSANRDVVICVHGLTRNGRDFDALAAALAPRYRVVCPDIVGRGRSDWLADKSQYDYPTYLADLAALLARVDAERVSWVGTSMGGIIGMLLAGLPNSPLDRLVLNDVGPAIPRAAVERIAGYVGADPDFGTYEEAKAYLQTIQAGWGSLDEDQWEQLARYGTRRDSRGRWHLGHDPGIAATFTEPRDVDLWAAWAPIECPMLVMRGADSDVLLPETVARMKAEKPGLASREWAGTGHAPSLMDPVQIAAIVDWLG